MRQTGHLSSDREIIDYLLQQMSAAGAVAAKPMFSKFGVYCDGKMVAIIGEDHLFLKSTAAGRSLASAPSLNTGDMNEWRRLGNRKQLANDRDWVCPIAKLQVGFRPD